MSGTRYILDDRDVRDKDIFIPGKKIKDCMSCRYRDWNKTGIAIHCSKGKNYRRCRSYEK